MNCLALTLGHGGDWHDLAVHAGNRMAASTGLPVRHLHATTLPAMCDSSSWLKLTAFEQQPQAEWVLWFDADVFAVREWYVPENLAPGFYGVAENDKPVLDEMAFWKLRHYWNGGLWLLHRNYSAVLPGAIACWRKGMRWYEQTALNVALQELAVPSLPLPGVHLRFNAEHDLAARPWANGHTYHALGFGLETERRWDILRRLSLDSPLKV